MKPSTGPFRIKDFLKPPIKASQQAGAELRTAFASCQLSND